MTSQPPVDAIYYSHGVKVPFATRVAIYARKRMYAHFLRKMRPQPETRILDFGASEATTEESNILEKLYPHTSRITCAGIGDGTDIKAEFPEIDYRSIEPGQTLPFADQAFDIAYSNAVFEHLGDDAAIKFALAELLRVARRVYVTVPNKFFPVEHHTGVPLLHYVPGLFRRVVRGTPLGYWAQPQNLEFLSARRIRSLLPRGVEFDVGYCGLAIGPFSSNIAFWTTGSAPRPAPASPSSPATE